MKIARQKIKELIAHKNLLKVIVAMLLVLMQIFTLFSFDRQTYADTVNGTPVIGLDLDVNQEALIAKPDPDAIAAALKEKPILEAQEKKDAERQHNIDILVSFLQKQKSPVASSDYAAQIIDLATANGADYRVVVAIMGVESGFCRQPLKIHGNSYNCFGYLNGVKYDSYQAAFNSLVPKISRQYAAKYGWDFVSLAQAYGEVGWQKTSADMFNYASSL